MKKLFFTAIALVAFSGMSMASTIDDSKGIKNQDKNDLEKNIVKQKSTCYDVAARMMSIYEDNHGCVEDAEYYNARFYSYYMNCKYTTS